MSAPRLDCDLLFAGAGAGGLSLAYALLERPGQERPGAIGGGALLLDPRARYDHDRTFCFFEVERHPFSDLISHRWPVWRVRAEGRSVERGDPRVPYAHLPADAFYQRALERIEGSGEARLELGVEVRALHDRGDHVEAETSRGSLRARLAFDSRPARAAPQEAASSGEVVLLQSFLGEVVEVDAPVFGAAQTATLMDFDLPQTHGLCFAYVLPFDARRALVEITFFAPEVPKPAIFEERLRGYLEEREGLRGWRTLRRERGVIPMSTAPSPQRSAPRIYRLGLAGGMAKPSTGYAFLAIQRYSRALAERLRSARVPEPPPIRPWRMQALDRIFLAYLARHPGRGPALFRDLFERVPAGQLARFLSDAVDSREMLEVMARTPIRGIASELLRARGIWMRR